jgi:hypothetical protein
MGGVYVTSLGTDDPGKNPKVQRTEGLQCGTNMPECGEHLGLSDAVVKAVDAVYRARTRQQEAVVNKQDSTPFAKSVLDTREAERRAVRELEGHRKQHGCKA